MLRSTSLVRVQLSVPARRFFSSQITREQRMSTALQQSLQAEFVDVQDVSGGCGAMYTVTVRSPLFRNKKTIEQHRMVSSLFSNAFRLPFFDGYESAR